MQTVMGMKTMINYAAIQNEPGRVVAKRIIYKGVAIQ
jgi:hypothetical protein